jgi:very-short-patch-repair endonuclease/DNA-directed RNA polymerase subunit RPC12/RpoP
MIRYKRGHGKTTKECEICKTSFESLINANRRFCSTECGYKGRTVHKNSKEYFCETCGKSVMRQPSTTKKRVFCSTACSGIASKGKPVYIPPGPRKKTVMTCTTCGKIFERWNAAILPGASFCSQSCSATHTNKYKRGSKSKLEKWLGVKLKERNIPVLLNNRELLNGYELDLYFPTKSVAVEIDGPWHSKPIGGLDHFATIQSNDAKKAVMCQQLGITLIRIPNLTAFTEQLGESVLAEIITQLDRHS